MSTDKKAILAIIGCWVFAGMLGIGGSVAMRMFGAGADLMGFTKWTLIYYMSCLCICILLVSLFKAAREHWKLLGFFGVSVILVMNMGAVSFLDAPISNGPLNPEQLQTKVLDGITFVTNAVMSVAPGALALFYSLAALEEAQPQKPDIG